MSVDADERRSLGALTAAEAALEHPLLGIERRRTAFTAVYLLGLVATFCVSYLGARVTIDDVVLDTLTTGFDALSAVFIAFVTLTILVVPLCYAAWNGGPVLSFVLPLVPVGLGDVIAGAHVLDLDVAIALTVGAAAAALALVSVDVRRADTLRFWRAAGDAEGRLLFVTAVAIVAAVGVRRFVAVAPSYVLEWYATFGALWPVTFGTLAVYWAASVRSVAPASDGESAVDR